MEIGFALLGMCVLYVPAVYVLISWSYRRHDNESNR